MISEIASLVASWALSKYGDDITRMLGLSNEDFDNKYIKRALERLDKMSREGYGYGTLNKMRRNVNLTYGAESSAQRAGTTQRLMRDDTPVQVREQILKDLSSSLSGKRMQALNAIDINNEEAKMNALSALMGGSLQAQPDTGQSELFGGVLGSVLSKWINSLDKKSIDINTSRLLGSSMDYYNNPSLGQSWAQNRKKYYGVL